MPFTWNFTKIKDWQKVCYDRVGEYDDDGEELLKLKQETDSLIWITRSVGINYLTEKNIDKFCLRVGMLEEVEGYFLFDRDKDGEKQNALTESVIRKHIGLSTSADSITDARFDRWVVGLLKNRVKRSRRT